MTEGLPSPRVAELMRTLAARLLEDPSEYVATIDVATLAAVPPAIAADAALSTSWHAANYATLEQWVRHTLAAPGAPVPVVLTHEGLGLARDLVRRGLDATSLNAYRAGQNVAWQVWMQGCFDLTSDPDELRELLSASARSIFGYVDATVDAITTLIESERDSLTSGAQSERLQAITLLLEGAPISVDTASARLGHDVRRRQVGAILWHDPSAPLSGELERAAQSVAAALGAPRPLVIAGSAASVWVWFSTEQQVVVEQLTTAVRAHPEVRLALGAAGQGVEGFRRTHLDAQAVQRLLLRRPDVQVGTWEGTRLAALVLADEERAQEYVGRVLGPLAHADPVLRETLRVYLREESSPSRAARVLYTHRNTVLNRLARAQALLPEPLAGTAVDVAAALETAAWL